MTLNLHNVFELLGAIAFAIFIIEFIVRAVR